MKNLYHIYIHSGTGGKESRNWIVTLFKIYIKWANINNIKFKTYFNYSILSNKNRYLIIEIYDYFSFKLFENEIGVHRLVQKNFFNSNKRHTSFASVNIYNFNKNKLENTINYKNLKIDFFKSSGSGGQHVNKTESAVRIKHVPTGIISVCQMFRSQHKNKHKAIKNLKKKIKYFDDKNNIFNKKKINDLNLNISWSNHIRSYILDNSIIKDIRTGIKVKNIKDVLNGNIGIFLNKDFKYNIKK